MTHISDLKVKSAFEIITEVDLNDDPYHNNIKHAASHLCLTFKGTWLYVAQYDSGATLWRHDRDKNRTIIVE